MNSRFYPKMALGNIRKNGKFYFPYLLTFIATVTMFYLMCAITFNKGIDDLPGADTLRGIFYLGCWVIAIFAVIFLFYTNSFLIKRRKKEFGLYNILGMEKRHIAVILFLESFYIALAGLAGGLITGIVMNKLIVMILVKVMGGSSPIPFSIDGSALQFTIILFGVIFLLILLANIHSISKADPVALLRGENVGEREPRTKIIMVVLGLLCLGGGYAIAIVTEDPISAILLFFVAVILVIIGTYCLFTAVSIAVLKLLRKNKKFYYRTGPFTAVSGMLYRMKQNAVGLANICILSTMVLVMVSTTVSMFIGAKDSIDTEAPLDFTMTQLKNAPSTMAEPKSLEEQQKQIDVYEGNVFEDIKEAGYTVSDVRRYQSLSLSLTKKNGAYQIQPSNIYGENENCYVQLYRLSDYNAMTDQALELKEDEFYLHEGSGHFREEEMILEKQKLIKRKELDSFPVKSQYDLNKNSWAIIVSDQTFDEIYGNYEEVMEERNGTANSINCVLQWNMSGSDEEKLAFSEKLIENYTAKLSEYVRFQNRQEVEKYSMAFYSGFMFLGIFLGILFVMATVLIIYYKQISEGYDDRARFSIMQKVGMSRQEVRKTIKMQILMVFFMPLLVAAIHITAAFPMIRRMLSVIYLDNVSLYMVCTVVTFLIFAAAYGAVYLLTARSYYKIVES